MTKSASFRYDKIKWLDIVKPDQAAILNLNETYDFHELDLEDCITKHQRSKIDEYEEYLFIVLHFPYYDKRRKRIVTEEIDIFIGGDYLITLHDGHLKVIANLVEKCEKEKAFLKEIMEKGTGYLLYIIIRELFNDCFPMIDDMEQLIASMERDLFEEETGKDMMRDILWLKKDIISFRLIIAPQRAVIAQLEHKNKKFLPEKLEVYFDDVVDKIEKLWSSLETLKEMAETLQNTNEVLISHQTNRVIKTLTVFSVVLLPLTVITGFYGMNVKLPYAHISDVALAIIIGMLILVLSMLMFFKWRRWV